jgi:peptide/nickel transport system substrate-binding protein
VREAFELSLDRDAIVQVAMDGEAVAGNQWGRAHQRVVREERADPEARREPRESAAARSRRRQSSFTLLTPTTADAQRVAQVVQSMAKEAGFDVKIQLTEFATTLNLADKGQYEAFVLAWSGRADPDGNIYSHLVSKQPLNYAGYANADFDKAITESRETNDPGQRAKLFEQAAKMEHRDRPSSISTTASGSGRTRTGCRASAPFPTGWCGCRT